nr:ISNCY family transposase [Paraburkholderia domus]
MAATDRITMTMCELDRFKVIQAVADDLLKPWRAAQRLGLTTRQIRRLVARLREDGPAGLVSGRCAKPSNNRLDAGTAARALAIIRERYADFGPTLACEKLYECHGIRLAKETVRRLMTDAGLWVPRRQRPPKVYQPRARRSCLGELIQIDGSEHPWFEDRAPQCTLLVYVDDATSRLMQVLFTATESTFSYFEATRAYIERHGNPSLSDRRQHRRVSFEDGQCPAEAESARHDRRSDRSLHGWDGGTRPVRPRAFGHPSHRSAVHLAGFRRKCAKGCLRSKRKTVVHADGTGRLRSNGEPDHVDPR